MVIDFFKKLFKFQESNVTVLKPEMKTVPIASAGTDINSGYISEEYLNALRGKDRAKVFDEMRRSDSQVRMLMNAVKNPITSATWDIEPGEDSNEARQDAAFIKHVLIDTAERPFKKTLREILACVEFGHTAVEKTYKLVMNDPEWGTYHGVASLGWISPKTIDRFNVDKDTGKLVSITQVAQGDLERYVDIPAEHIMLFSLDQEGANYEGISWLRPCYGNYLRKNEYLKLNAIGIEKFAVPTPRVKVPPGFQNQESFNTLIEALQIYTSGEANYITYPSAFEIDFGVNSTYDPAKVDTAIDSEDRRMSKSFVANFLELGMGGAGGAFSLSNDLSDFFTAGIVHIADEVAELFNLDLIPTLIKMNRGTRKVYPKLKHFGISDKAGKELAEVLGILGEKKFIIPDRPLEDKLRKLYNISPVSDIDKREVNPQQTFGLSERVRKKIYGN